MLIMSNIGDHVWLMTSRQTDPDLDTERRDVLARTSRVRVSEGVLHGHAQLVDVGVEYPVLEPDTRGLIRVVIGELDMDFPNSAFERRCCEQVSESVLRCAMPVSEGSHSLLGRGIGRRTLAYQPVG